ncbi:hypothetical protein RGU70_02340 [Herbaspirillum sp. RTI4]|uniref:hypothetical protein n=1 Tax=Herbaspirillum sp. RTI4 TaxID=3048640 RepID=UPI002AB53CA4|nr:hypothetical protein [Herbaspirillum sp. RTI4]MDY7577166.1 hypothetical protein [Herbaspirillum sp. RTI4]MEA9980456.1 hypothetical protein [Herbaspirillum sp. RTI4]
MAISSSTADAAASVDQGIQNLDQLTEINRKWGEAKAKNQLKQGVDDMMSEMASSIGKKMGRLNPA